jgi:glycosyltransferase involved in cell wall biosynthesis
MISFIIPSYNNLKHLKNVYTSIVKNAPQSKIMFLDDGSTDGTWEWLMSLPKDNLYPPYRSEERVGHTILYDKGISLVQEEIVGILHADMIVGPNYVENILKHLKPGKVVCGTRIEPPLHPEGKEKIIKDFGLDFDSLDIKAFEEYCLQAQSMYKDQTTKGMFAPWVIYKSDFESIGGHDPLFAPFPYEDSDIFQRWILNGFELIQSRDAFVYHLTCRGHRWTEQVGKDDDYYKNVSQRAARNYIRKWGSWIKNDEYQYPIISHKYNIGFVVNKCNLETLSILEPWCDTIYIDDDMGVLETSYYELEQKHTKFDLLKRIKTIKYSKPDNDIIIEFDATKLNNNSFNIIQNISDIITSSGDIGIFELDIFKITIKTLNTYEDSLVHIYNK